MAKKKEPKKSTPKKEKKDHPLKVNTSFENLMKMIVDTPPKKKTK